MGAPDVIDRPNRIPWPPLLLVSAGIAAVIAGRFLPIQTNWSGAWPIRVVGIAILLAAAAVDVAAMREMRRWRANILPHRAATALVTTGPFAFSRNPIYLANLGLLLGAGLAFNNAWFLLSAVLDGMATFALAIRREEAHLASKFGLEWERYSDWTRRWIGRRRR